MSDSFLYDVFLSHSKPDKPVVLEIAERLQRDGLKVWFDEWAIKPGQSIPAKIDEGLEQSRLFILCMSVNGTDSEWAQLEQYSHRFHDPLNKGGRFIPLRLDESPLKPSLAHFLYINWSAADREQEYAKLLEACRGKATQPLAWAPSLLIKQPNNLPFTSLGSLFKGRNEFLNEIHSGLEQGLEHGHHASAIVGTQAVYGLGGLGKTRAAIEYAWRHAGKYSALLFASAEIPEILDKSLADLSGPLILNLEEQDASEQSTRIRAVLTWLRRHPGWLLILDNVDDDRAAMAVEGLIRQLPTGHVLITSRFGEWGSGIQRLDLETLSAEASMEFLQERTRGKRRLEADDESSVVALAKELDGLPLALEQAAAFIVAKTESFGGYLRRWHARESKVRTWHDAVRMRYPRSLAVTWDTSFKQLDASSRALLNCLCWFAPEPIPVHVWQSDSGAQAIARSAGDESSVADPEEALAGLTRYGLIQRSPDRTAFRVHRLVQEVTRQRLPDPSGSLQNALEVVDDYLPADPPPQDIRSWPRWNPVREHVAILIEAAEQYGITKPTARLMGNLALLLHSKGLWHSAEGLNRRALAIDEQSYGAEHPHVARDLNNLALLLKATNRLTEAEPLMRRALAIDEQSYGAEHPNVARDLNNLAQLLQATNRLTEAEPLMRRALAIDEQSYGAEHPSIAIRLNNLAQLLQATNRLTEAEPLMRRALAIDEQSYGAEHPHVARDLNNLALLLKATNRLTEAEPLMRRALAIDEQSYGAEHPTIGLRLCNLAALLYQFDCVQEAIPLIDRSVSVYQLFQQQTGFQHPHWETVVSWQQEIHGAAGSSDPDS